MQLKNYIFYYDNALNTKADKLTSCLNSEVGNKCIVANDLIINKADKTNNYPKAEMNVALSILQAGIDNRGLSNAVDSNGNFTVTATSNDILKIQRVDGSLLYDAFELSFNNVAKTLVLITISVDKLQSINNSVAVNAYSKSEIDIGRNL